MRPGQNDVLQSRSGVGGAIATAPPIMPKAWNDPCSLGFDGGMLLLHMTPWGVPRYFLCCHADEHVKTAERHLYVQGCFRKHYDEDGPQGGSRKRHAPRHACHTETLIARTHRSKRLNLPKTVSNRANLDASSSIRGRWRVAKHVGKTWARLSLAETSGWKRLQKLFCAVGTSWPALRSYRVLLGGTYTFSCSACYSRHSNPWWLLERGGICAVVCGSAQDLVHGGGS